MDHLGGGKWHPERYRHHGGGAHRGTDQGSPDNASRLGEGVNPQVVEGEVGRVRTVDRLNETWTCADGHAPPSH